MSAATWTATNDQLVQLLEGTCGSATRVRQVLIVMATASVIIFTAVWNSLSISWMHWHAGVVTAMEVWLTYHEDENEKKRWDGLKTKVEKAKPTTDEERDRLETDKKHLDAWMKAMKAGETYFALTLQSPADIKEGAKKARDMLREHASMIRIPFFGVDLDINDTTLIGGFTLWIIMMWLRLSLWRQCSNLSMAFAQAEAAQQLQFAYRYVSMQQVLSVPPPTQDADRDLRPRHGAPPVLFFLPFFVQLFAVGNDIWTFGAVSHSTVALIHAVVQTLVAFVLLGILGLLTVQCLKLRADSARIWQHYLHRLHS